MPSVPAHPAVYVREASSGPRPIEGVATSVAAFVGLMPDGPLNRPVLVRGRKAFERRFGAGASGTEGSDAVELFFDNGGAVAWVVRVDAEGSSGPADAFRRGLGALRRLRREPAMRLLAMPGATSLGRDDVAAIVRAANELCLARRAFLVLDVPSGTSSVADVTTWQADLADRSVLSASAALYYPRLVVDDATAARRDAPASGAVLGVYARTDATRGVWKAPAGTAAAIRGASLMHAVDDVDGGTLNRSGVNVLRDVHGVGPVVWGARTSVGADGTPGDWKYVPVRRTALFIEASVERGLQWTVFEPNDEPLWATIRDAVGTFLHGLFRSGAFAGNRPSDAWFVQCDPSTTTQSDIDAGRVNVTIGFAPARPAEFVVTRITLAAAKPSA